MELDHDLAKDCGALIYCCSTGLHGGLWNCWVIAKGNLHDRAYSRFPSLRNTQRALFLKVWSLQCAGKPTMGASRGQKMVERDKAGGFAEGLLRGPFGTSSSNPSIENNNCSNVPQMSQRHAAAESVSCRSLRTIRYTMTLQGPATATDLKICSSKLPAFPGRASFEGRAWRWVSGHKVLALQAEIVPLWSSLSAWCRNHILFHATRKRTQVDSFRPFPNPMMTFWGRVPGTSPSPGSTSNAQGILL